MADIAKKKYVDSVALKHLLEVLRDKNKELFLGKMAEAASAAKVANALTLTVGDTDVVFDGSEAKSTAVAAKVHTHKSTDISDFAAAVKKAAFGDENASMTAHAHDNKGVLDTISADRVAKWDAKISVDDVAKIKYENTGMTSVKDVKGALDVLVANVQIAAGQLDLTSKNMDAVKKIADDAAKAAAAEVTRAQNAEKGLDARLDVIEGEGEGSIKKALADAKTYADGKDTAIQAAQAAAEAAQADVDALEGKVGEIPADKTVIGLIGEAKAQADKGVSDASAEATRAKGVEAELRTDLGEKGAAADAEGSAFARIAKVKADLAAEVTRADTAEKANAAAAKAAQDDVDALEALVGDAADTKDEATVYGAIAAEKARAEGKEGELRTDLGQKTDAATADTAFGKIAKLNADKNTEGSVDYKIDQAINNVNTTTSGLDTRVGALETKVGNAGDTAKADGSLYARVAKNAADIDAIEADYLKSTDKTELQNAINVEKGRLDTFMADADVSAKAVDTLKEIQQYITKDGKAAATMTTNIANNKAAIDTINDPDTGILATAKKYAEDQDAAQKEALESAIATAKSEAISAAASDAASKDSALETKLQGKIDLKADKTALETEVNRATAAEQANANAIATLNGGVNTEGSVAKAVNDAKTTLTAEIAKKADTATLNAKVEELKAADTKLSERIAKFEGDGEGSVAAQVKAVADDLKAHKEAQVTKEKAVDDKLAVIQGEANVEGSIKKALADAKSYTDTRESAINGLLGTKDDAATVDTAFGRIAKEVARATAAEEALGGRIDASNNRIAALEATVDTATTGLKDRVAVAEGEIDTLQADVDAAEADIVDLQAFVAAHGTITNTEIDEMLNTVYGTQA